MSKASRIPFYLLALAATALALQAQAGQAEYACSYAQIGAKRSPLLLAAKPYGEAEMAEEPPAQPDAAWLGEPQDEMPQRALPAAAPYHDRPKSPAARPASARAPPLGA